MFISAVVRINVVGIIAVFVFRLKRINWLFFLWGYDEGILKWKPNINNIWDLFFFYVLVWKHVSFQLNNSNRKEETFLYKQTEIWSVAAGELLPAVTFSTPNRRHGVPMWPPQPPGRAVTQFQVTALAFLFQDGKKLVPPPTGCLPALKGATGDHRAARSD